MFMDKHLRKNKMFNAVYFYCNICIDKNSAFYCFYKGRKHHFTLCRGVVLQWPILAVQQIKVQAV